MLRVFLNDGKVEFVVPRLSKKAAMRFRGCQDSMQQVLIMPAETRRTTDKRHCDARLSLGKPRHYWLHIPHY